MIKTRAEFLRRFNLQLSPKIERRVDNVLKQKLRPAAVMIVLLNDLMAYRCYSRSVPNVT